MTLEEIKAALDAGTEVYWMSKAYQVIKDSKGQYLIKCIPNGICIGLTWTDEVTMNGKEEDFFSLDGLSFDTIKEEMDSKYYLHHVHHTDDLNSYYQEIQDCIHQDTMTPLFESLHETLADMEWHGRSQAIDDLKRTVADEHDLNETSVDQLFEKYDGELLEELCNRDKSTPLDDMIRHTDNPVMFFDTGVELGGYYDDTKDQVRQIKKALKIPAKNKDYDKRFTELVLEASYGGKLLVYFRGDLSHWLTEYSGKEFNTITFSGPNVAIGIADHSGGSGSYTHIQHSFSLPFNRENVFLEKLIKCNLTYAVYDMGGSWCDDTQYSLTSKPKRKPAERSDVNNHLDREKRFNEAFAAGKCSPGDTDMRRHRNTYYRNDLPCGTKCPDCGQFWID